MAFSYFKKYEAPRNEIGLCLNNYNNDIKSSKKVITQSVRKRKYLAPEEHADVKFPYTPTNPRFKNEQKSYFQNEEIENEQNAALEDYRYNEPYHASGPAGKRSPELKNEDQYNFFNDEPPILSKTSKLVYNTENMTGKQFPFETPRKFSTKNCSNAYDHGIQKLESSSNVRKFLGDISKTELARSAIDRDVFDSNMRNGEIPPIAAQKYLIGRNSHLRDPLDKGQVINKTHEKKKKKLSNASHGVNGSIKRSSSKTALKRAKVTCSDKTSAIIRKKCHSPSLMHHIVDANSRVESVNVNRRRRICIETNPISYWWFISNSRNRVIMNSILKDKSPQVSVAILDIHNAFMGQVRKMFNFPKIIESNPKNDQLDMLEKKYERIIELLTHEKDELEEAKNILEKFDGASVLNEEKYVDFQNGDGSSFSTKVTSESDNDNSDFCELLDEESELLRPMAIVPFNISLSSFVGLQTKMDHLKLCLRKLDHFNNNMEANASRLSSVMRLSKIPFGSLKNLTS